MDARPNRSTGFTLIELLVVISIIVVLMSILLPAIRKTRTVAGQGMCAKQIQAINQAFHAYAGEHMEHIPLTTGTANQATWFAVDHVKDLAIGMGCIWEARLVEDHRTFYCPGADHDDAPSQWHFRSRVRSKEDLPERVRQRSGYPVVDYAIGYASAGSSITGPCYNQFPREIVSPDDTLENLKAALVAWMADTRASIGAIHPGQYTTHNEYAFMNFGCVDGSSRSVIDVGEAEPSQLEMTAAGVPGCDHWWFHNGRAPMLFWRWYGPGHGF